MINKIDINLIYELGKKDIKERYMSSALGLWWAVLTPIGTLAIFTFVFGEIFQAKWNGSGDLVEFGVRLYAGLIVFWFFAEVLTRAPSLIYSNPNYVKKVVFKLEILPISAVMSAFFTFVVNWVVLVFAAWWLRGQIGIEILWGVVLMISCIPVALGLSWILAALGAYLRDISAIIGVAMNALMFLSPVFYPIDSAPKGVRWVFDLNPLSFIIESMRESMINGEHLVVMDVVIYAMSGAVCAWVGYRVFMSLRKGFADVV